MQPATEELAEFVAGFIAAEGAFLRTGEPPVFTFAVQLGGADAVLCFELQRYFQVGNVHTYRRRKVHYDDAVVYTVRAFRDLLEVVVPFMDAHLPESYKRRQYEIWRADLLAYWEHAAKRRRTCSEPGCERPQRAKGLCRHHYFLTYPR